MKLQLIDKKTSGTLLALILLLATVNVFAVELSWNITGGAYTDEGTFSGSFKYDANTNIISDWNISIAGGNTTIFPAITMTPQNSKVSIFNFQNPQDTFQFELSDDSNRQLRFTPDSPLTDAGGVVALNLNTARGASGGVECFNCGPARTITAGQLESGEAPAIAPKPEGLSGLWYDPKLDGEGYNIINASNGMVVYYYGYSASGQRLWLLSDVHTKTIRFNETITLAVSEFKGGLFAQPLDSQSASMDWGTLAVSFTSCDAGTFTLTGADGQKTSEVIKLAGIVNTDC